MDGVAFKKTFSYAGFEMQPRSFDNPKVLLLNIELELKAEKENAEVRTKLHCLLYYFQCTYCGACPPVRCIGCRQAHAPFVARRK